MKIIAEQNASKYSAVWNIKVNEYFGSNKAILT